LIKPLDVVYPSGTPGRERRRVCIVPGFTCSVASAQYPMKRPGS
jgi:hypothetical protein